jgi:hypothetical protein
MPLLFEEFGKKLDNPDDTAAIRQLRDPVFGATFDAVQTAVEQNKPLLGSLYWKWAVPGLPKGECYVMFSCCHMTCCYVTVCVGSC